jgi:hypothetical protein
MTDRKAKIMSREWQGRRTAAPGRRGATTTMTRPKLSWRAFVVRQNFSNCRSKIIDPGARDDDAVTAAMSFFGDAQESPALIFPELHVEMLALYLQFSRLDDVIHFL